MRHIREILIDVLCGVFQEDTERRKQAERLCDPGAEREMFFLRAKDECAQRAKTWAEYTASKS